MAINISLDTKPEEDMKKAAEILEDVKLSTSDRDALTQTNAAVAIALIALCKIIKAKS